MSRLDHRALKGRVRIAEVLLAVIVVVGAVIVGDTIVTGSIFSSPYKIAVELPDAAGLHKRSDVAYRGQHIGMVDKVSLSENGIRVDITIEDGVKIPRDSEYVVANLSPVGEQYLDIRPRTADGPFLTAGDTIDGRDAVLPLPVWRLLSDTQKLIKRIDVADIQVISEEIDAAFGAKDVDLRGLLGEVSRTLDTAENLSPSVFALLKQAQGPLQTVRDLEPTVRTFVGNAQTVAAALRRAAPGIGRLIDQGAVVIPVISSQLDAMSPTMVALLDATTPVAEMAEAHLPGLLHWYTWTPRQLEAMKTATRDGAGHVVLVVTGAKNCHYGPDVSPYEEKADVPLSTRCTSTDPDLQQRGSQYVPRQ